MIFDKLDNWNLYPLGGAWQKAFEFIASLTPDAEEKRYEIDGDNIWAQLMSYDTHPIETADLENHQVYIDIQTPLAGTEFIECVPVQGLSDTISYDADRDIAFFKYSTEATPIRLSPGTFAMFYPHDAHMPGVMINNQPQKVKKAVVKIKVDLLSKI